MEKDGLYYYDKAVKRLKGISKTDPTSIIATLEKEIDSYRTRIQRLESEKKFTKIQKNIGEINFNSATIVDEDSLFLYVSSQYGESCFLKLELAKFWLTHDNDCFYKTFGFSWVPSDKLQEEARKHTDSNASFTIGIDFGINKSQNGEHSIPVGMCKDILEHSTQLESSTSENQNVGHLIPDEVLKDIMSNLNPLDVSKHNNTFNGFHN